MKLILVLAALLLLVAACAPSQPAAAPQNGPAQPPAAALAQPAQETYEVLSQTGTSIVLRCNGVNEDDCKAECFRRDPCAAQGKTSTYSIKELSLGGNVVTECRLSC